MENSQETKIKSISYYGKKTYRIHPMLARLKSIEVKLPDFSGENIDDKIDK